MVESARAALELQEKEAVEKERRLAEAERDLEGRNETLKAAESRVSARLAQLDIDRALLVERIETLQKSTASAEVAASLSAEKLAREKAVLEKAREAQNKRSEELGCQAEEAEALWERAREKEAELDARVLSLDEKNRALEAMHGAVLEREKAIGEKEREMQGEGEKARRGMQQLEEAKRALASR
jgi:hypothetical protein